MTGSSGQHGVGRRPGRRLRWVLGAIAVTVMMTAFAATQRFRPNPHGADDACGGCHLGPPPVGLAPPTPSGPRAAARYGLRYPRERAVCERCHRGHGEQTHPVEVAARLPVPKGWPLDAQGRLMCSTCHDPHQRAGASKKTAQSNLLRGKQLGPAFCQACHGPLGEDSRSWHVVVTQSAHRTVTDGAASPNATLDPLSARCLACHDGTLGKGVGVRYRASAPAKPVDERSPRLRPEAMLDKRIRLFNGKVGCGSCHDPYSRNRKFLVIDPSHGRLCRSCHDM